MITRRFAWFLSSVACLTFLTYVGLVVLATGCASMSVAQSGSHHHSQESTPSALCAWSCQMISQSGPAVSVAMARVSLVATPVPLPHASTYSITPSAFHSSRAPPVVSLG